MTITTTYTGDFVFNSRPLFKQLTTHRDISKKRLTDTGGVIVTYAIVNTKTGYAYVGSTEDFFNRWRKHYSRLIRGGHDNDQLQRAYDQDGDHFVIRIIGHYPATTDLLLLEEIAAVPYDGKLYNYRVGNNYINGWHSRNTSGSKAGGYTPQTKRAPNSKIRWFDGTGKTTQRCLNSF